jgi:hypothetical protein
MSAHSWLSPSKSATWLHCPAAPRICGNVPEETSEYAQEGTEAHAQAAAMLLGQPDTFPQHKEAVAPYVEMVQGLIGPDDTLLIEQEVTYDEWVTDGYGTSDCIILHSNGLLTNVDLKFGQGVKVYAKDNSQLRLYALGAIQGYQFTHNIDRVRMIISQPRLDHQDEEELSLDDLLAWGEWVKERVHLILDPNVEAVPGDKQCRWCAARKMCRARITQLVNIIGSEHITPADVAMLMPYVEQVKTWVRDLEEHALELLLAGTEVPGYKLVEGRSLRKFTADAASKLLDVGLTEEQIYVQEMRTMSEIEKALGGKKKAVKVMEEITIKPQGKPTIVETSDPRPRIEADIVAQFPISN